MAALLWSDRAGWGIDIEEARLMQLERVASRVLNPDETDFDLLQAWTLKEAAFKAAGLPIADLREIHLCHDGTITARNLRLTTVHSSSVDNGWLSVVKQ